MSGSIGLNVVLEARFSNPNDYGTGAVHLENRLTAYSHEIRANGGFWSAEVSFGITVGEIDEYMSVVIGRILRVYGRGQQLAWEGFVNSVDMTIGGNTITVGPMTEVANSVAVTYAPVDYSVYPPVVGSTTITTLIEDETSQTKYGYIEHIINAGQCTATEASEIAALYLAEHKNVVAVGDISITGEGKAPVQVTLHCLGFFHAFDFYPYNSTTAGYTTISAKLSSVIGANTNSYPKTSSTYIDTNSFAIPYYDDEDRLARTIIEELVSMGDANNNRFIFGVYEKGRCYYNDVPNQVEYVYRSTMNSGGVFGFYSGELVDPLDIRPGKWLLLADILPGQKLPGSVASMMADPRMRFIETVEFTAPNTINISGGTLSRVDIALARLGLGGML